MLNRTLFNSLLEFDSSTKQRNCHGKRVTDYPLILNEMYYRQMLLTQQFTQWDAEKGVHWLIGFANYLNQNSERKQYPDLLSHKYSFGDIIDVDFFGGFTNELTFDHPAVVLKNFYEGVMIAPITSNKGVYSKANSVSTHIKLPKNAFPYGYMVKDSTIKLEQTRYISKARILRFRERERLNSKTGVKFIQVQRITDPIKQGEIKEALMHIFASSLYYDFLNEKTALQSKLEFLDIKYTDAQYEMERQQVAQEELLKLYEDLLEENIQLKETIEQNS